MPVYLGYDPEFWVVKKNGNLVAPWKEFGFFEDKHPYFKTRTAGYNNRVRLNIHGFISRDGCSLEVNFDSGDTCRDRIIPAIGQTLYDFLKDHKDKYSLVAWPIREIPRGVLRDAPEDVFMSGCEPDINAYTGEFSYEEEFENNIRYAGGHLHFGNTTLAGMTDEELRGVVKWLDIHVAIPFILSIRHNKPLLKAERIRRKVYGKAGSYRRKEYGLEYRVLSSAAFMHPAMVYMLSHLARSSISLFSRSGLEPNIPYDLIRNAVDEVDVDSALEAFHTFKDRGPVFEQPTIAKIVDKGAFSYICRDVVHNWGLEKRPIDHQYFGLSAISPLYYRNMAHYPHLREIRRAAGIQ